MKKANQFQVGGDHYGRAKIQHWDYTECNGLGYLEGCATKYATRSRKKHETPVQDWMKAQHYVLKLLDLFRDGLRLNRRLELNAAGTPLVIGLEEFAESNELTADEQTFVGLMTFWSDEQDLQEAVAIASKVLKDLEFEGKA